MKSQDQLPPWTVRVLVTKPLMYSRGHGLCSAYVDSVFYPPYSTCCSLPTLTQNSLLSSSLLLFMISDSPVLMAVGRWSRHPGNISPSMIDTPKTKRFLLEFISTCCRFDTPTDTMIPSTNTVKHKQPTTSTYNRPNTSFSVYFTLVLLDRPKEALDFDMFVQYGSPTDTKL